EVTRIERDGTGARYTDEAGSVHRLTGDEVVSLNTWGFNAGLMAYLRQEFSEFLRNRGSDPKAEFYIPSAVNNIMAAGHVRVKVLRTPDSWFGITYREDRAQVVGSIRALIEQGVYPKELR